MKKKYVLCRPQGGINDNLTQIENCWRYAKASGRTLIIDTNKSGGFSLPFGRFFREIDPKGNALLFPSPLLFERLENLNVFPSCTSGKLNNYKAIYSPEIRNFVEEESKIKLSFDFKKMYHEDLLLSDQCGGGMISIHCLAKLRMTNEFRNDILEQLKFIGNSHYASIPIRHNADYQSDYKSIFNNIYDKIEGKRLLVCSDNQEVIDYAHSFFKKTKVLSFPAPDCHIDNIPYANLIGNLDESSKYKLVVKAFSDLIGLSASSQFFPTRLKNGGIHGGYSGFVLLAANLFKNKGVIRQLLS